MEASTGCVLDSSTALSLRLWYWSSVRLVVLRTSVSALSMVTAELTHAVATVASGTVTPIVSLPPTEDRPSPTPLATASKFDRPSAALANPDAAYVASTSAFWSRLR